MELELYIYSFIFLLGSAYALKEDKHVRVDLFYSKWSNKKKAFVDLIGGLLYLLPWCTVLVIVSFQYALSSWKIGETSSQPGGLPAIYILKSTVFVAFTLLFLQGVSSILKSITCLMGNDKYYSVSEDQAA
jgi:TRAP-type mannitol/chloroaromatic compound transport system permease small subunit